MQICACVTNFSGCEKGMVIIMEQSRLERDTGLDAVRGFAILLVMLGHCIVLNNMADAYLYDAIKAVQMPLFMAVSGVLMGRKKIRMTGRELGRQLKKRALSCLVPFVSWIFVTNVTNFPQKLRSVLFRPDTGLWFLLTLFILSAMLLFALFVRDGLSWGWIGFGAAVILEAGLLCVHYLSGSTFLGPALTVNYFPFFFGGFFAGVYWRNESTGKHAAWLLWLLAAAGFLFLVARYDMVYAHNRLEWLIQLAASALGTSAAFWGIYHLKAGRLQRGLAGIGTYTLEIYVLHFRFARILGIGNAGLSLYSVKGACAVAATFVIMSVLTAFFIVVLKQLAVTDFLLFGKRRVSDGARSKKRVMRH